MASAPARNANIWPDGTEFWVKTGTNPYDIYFKHIPFGTHHLELVRSVPQNVRMVTNNVNNNEYAAKTYYRVVDGPPAADNELWKSSALGTITKVLDQEVAAKPLDAVVQTMKQGVLEMEERKSRVRPININTRKQFDFLEKEIEILNHFIVVGEQELEKQRARQVAEEANRQRIAAEEANRQRIAAEEANRQRIAAEEAERQQIAAEEAERQQIANRQEQAERRRRAAIAAERRRQDAIAADQWRQDAISAERRRQDSIAADQQRQDAISAERRRQAAIAANGRRQQAAFEAYRQQQAAIAERQRQAAIEAERQRQAALVAAAQQKYVNIVVPPYIPKNIVLERLSGRMKPHADDAAKESVLEMFPIENRRINTELGMMEYKREDVNIVADILNPELRLPISNLQGIEIQHLVRQLHVGQGNSVEQLTQLKQVELNDPDYCKPEPIQTPADSCSICLESESESRRLYKVHYVRSPAQGEHMKLCLLCIFNYIKSIENYLAAESYKCFDADEGCDRKITEYMLYRTIYYNQAEEKLNGIEPLRLEGGKLLRDAFTELIDQRREALAARETQAAERVRIQREQREKEERERREREALNARRREHAEQTALAQRERNAPRLARELLTSTVREKASFFNIIKEMDNRVMCPYCFEAVEKIEGCIYLKHFNPITGHSTTCPTGPALSMLARFPPNPTHNLQEWCEVCGRPCRTKDAHSVHNHFKIDGYLGGPIQNAIHNSTGQFSAKDLSGAELICVKAGGGGRVEYFVRINAVRDELIDSWERGEFLIDERMKERFAARTQRYLGNGVQKRGGEFVGEYLRARKIMDDKEWDRVLPAQHEFPPALNEPVAAAASASEEAVTAGMWGWFQDLTVRDVLRQTIGRFCKLRGGGAKTYKRSSRPKKRQTRKY